MGAGGQSEAERQHGETGQLHRDGLSLMSGMVLAAPLPVEHGKGKAIELLTPRDHEALRQPGAAIRDVAALALGTCRAKPHIPGEPRRMIGAPAPARRRWTPPPHASKHAVELR
jgi:hypothetical protein